MKTYLHPESRRSGHTMLLVAMLSTVTLGLTTVAFRTTDDAILTENFQADRDFRDEVISGALGRGVEYLREGDPPKNPFRYVETFTLADGSKFYTQVTIERQNSKFGLLLDEEGYTVVAQPANEADLIQHGPPPWAHGPGGNPKHDDEDDCEGGDDGDDGDDGDGKSKGRGLGWGVGGIPPGSDEGEKSGWGGGDKPPGNPGPDKNDDKGKDGKGKGGKD